MLGDNYELPITDRQVAENFGEHPTLNVGSAVAIVAYEALKQTGSFDNFRFK